LGGSNPSKSRENCGEVRVPKIFGRAVLGNPEKPWGKTAFREFFGSPKNCGTPREDPNFEPCSSRENREEFLDEPVLQNPETLWKNPRFEIFLGPLKIAGNRRKIQNFETWTSRENRKKIQNSKPVPKISQLANPPIFFSFLLTSASK
jgi:hypothetical protein